MKIYFVDVKSDVDVNARKLKIKGDFCIIATLQYEKQAKELARILKKQYAGVVLGCNIDNALKFAKDVDRFLLIGSGKFHALRVALKTNKEVIIYNPETDFITKITRKDLENYKKKLKGKQARFLAANTIGILVSIKQGQFNYSQALSIKEKLEKLGKECYLFLFDTLHKLELENFPFVGCWINTACPGIEGKNIINLEDLPKI